MTNVPKTGFGFSGGGYDEFGGNQVDHGWDHHQRINSASPKKETAMMFNARMTTAVTSAASNMAKLTHGESKTGVHEEIDEVRYTQTFKRKIGSHLCKNIHDSIDDKTHYDASLGVIASTCILDIADILGIGSSNLRELLHVVVLLHVGPQEKEKALTRKKHKTGKRETSKPSYTYPRTLPSAPTTAKEMPLSDIPRNTSSASNSKLSSNENLGWAEAAAATLGVEQFFNDSTILKDPRCPRLNSAKADRVRGVDRQNRGKKRGTGADGNNVHENQGRHEITLKSEEVLYAVITFDSFLHITHSVRLLFCYSTFDASVPGGAIGTKRVVKGIGGLCTAGDRASSIACDIHQSTTLSYSRSYHTYMEVVPDLGDLSSTIVHRASTSSSLVKSRTTAANIGQSTISSSLMPAWFNQPQQGTSKVEKQVPCLLNSCPQKSLFPCQFVNDFYNASCIPVRSTLVDPVLVHPCEEVVFAERLEESANVGTLVRGNNSAIGQAVVTVLSVRAIAEVGPQAVQRPLVGRQQLTLSFEASVCRPELSREEESSICFGAARVDGVGVGGAGAGQDGVVVGCGCIALATCKQLSQ
ncbi:ribonuclease T2, partial [Aureobasidium melanogenum]